ncbi:MAG: hypothetical protein EZS28_009793 [Streblomastix strix]|uniref:Uncharacterized protein n=1 Tax=Streblomastix strix TaxID=222440 RepID=A0A5J4WJJ0_9EUKA|nr:MAG: hypothetical protein EZS28_009793 [Streblomastix strix]
MLFEFGEQWENVPETVRSGFATVQDAINLLDKKTKILALELRNREDENAMLKHKIEELSEENDLKLNHAVSSLTTLISHVQNSVMLQKQTTDSLVDIIHQMEDRIDAEKVSHIEFERVNNEKSDKEWVQNQLKLKSDENKVKQELGEKASKQEFEQQDDGS